VFLLLNREMAKEAKEEGNFFFFFDSDILRKIPLSI
jgi:hypothetical protein